MFSLFAGVMLKLGSLLQVGFKVVDALKKQPFKTPRRLPVVAAAAVLRKPPVPADNC